MTRFVVEADGGSRGNPGPSGYGALVRDATGAVLVERAAALGITTNNVAEYSGLVAALRAAHELDPAAEIEVRMDSKLVVEQMSGRWQIKHAALQPLARSAREAHPPSLVRYTWIPRERNKDADRLANAAMDAAARGEVWDESRGPLAEDVVPAVQADGSPAAPMKMIGWDDVGVPTTFVLVRHGESINTVARLFCGRGGVDPELTARGHDQARAAASALPALLQPLGVAVAGIVASPLRRAQQTAAHIAESLDLGVKTEAGFAEADFGDWDGLDLASVRAKWPSELQAWLASPDVAPPGGGESVDAVSVRVRAARDRVISRFAGRTVLVVSHVTPIKELVRSALGAPAASVLRMELPPASVQVVQWWPDGGSTLRLFGASAHLAGLLPDRSA